MWKQRYLRLLNTITAICIIAGLAINVFKFAAVGLFSFVRSSESSTVTEGGSDIGDFDSIDADLSFGTLKVEYGDDYSYRYTGFTNETTPEFKVKGNKLEIRQKNNINFNIFKDKNIDGIVTVTIPKNVEPDMDISLNMGSFELTDITLGNLSMDADMGAVTLKNCKFKDVEVQADMGGITFTNCTFDDGTFDANMGGITISKCTFSSANCDADMGSIDVSGTYNSLTAEYSGTI